MLLMGSSVILYCLQSYSEKQEKGTVFSLFSALLHSQLKWTNFAFQFRKRLLILVNYTTPTVSELHHGWSSLLCLYLVWYTLTHRYEHTCTQIKKIYFQKTSKRAQTTNSFNGSSQRVLSCSLCHLICLRLFDLPSWLLKFVY